MFARVLVPLDGSSAAEAILPRVAELARGYRTDVILLRVVLAHTFPGVDPTEAQVHAVDEAQDYLAAVERSLRSRGIRAESAVRYGRPAEEILDHARVHGVDLIAMATHGRSGIQRWVLGSVAEAVLRAAPVPVLLLRLGAPVAQEAEATAHFAKR